MPPMQSLRLTPNRLLEFNFRPNQSISIDLNLENVADQPVAFKIKTTAPKGYLVRPSTGILQGRTAKSVQIVMQPLSSEPTNYADRFLVQAVKLESSDTQLSREFWSNVDKNMVEDQRLSVTFGASGEGENKASLVGIERSLHQPPQMMENSSLQERYEETLQYCCALERTKNQLMKELESLRALVESLKRELLEAREAAKDDVPRRNASPSSQTAPEMIVRTGFPAWQVAVISLLLVAAMKAYEML